MPLYAIGDRRVELLGEHHFIAPDASLIGAITLEADANLVLGSTDLAFTPSKILAVLAAGRPVLALAPAGSAMVGRLAAFDQSCATFSLPAPGQPEIAALARQLCDLAAGRRPAPAAGAWAQGSAAVVAARQLEMLAAA